MACKLVNISLLLMPPAMLLSCVGLSALLIVFLLATLAVDTAYQNLKNLSSEEWYVLMVLLFLLPLLSSLWAADLEEWGKIIIVKLSLLLMSLAFAAMGTIDRSCLRAITWCFLITVLAGAGWSMLIFISSSLVKKKLTYALENCIVE